MNENERTIIVNAELNIKSKGKTIEISIPQLNLRKIFITNSDGKISGIIKTNNLLLWSPENPVLYNIELKLNNEIIKDEIGFRIIESSGKKLLLNGKPIFLRGVSIHDEKSNGGGRTNSPEDARELLGWAKELGCNYVRLAHYPHNEYMIREAEKLGIMVWSEIPVYWTISWDNLKTFDNAKSQLTNMINRDKNRANVIIWSIANETPKGFFRDQFLSQLALYIKTLDNTRLISMAMELNRNKKHINTIEDDMNKYVDIISINEYYGWYRRVKYINRLIFNIPYNKPIIISEFGEGAKYGYHGDKNQRWTEEFQENIYIQTVEMLDKIDGLVGTSPWILKDFRSPRRVLNGMQDYYNMKGLISDKGQKKKAFYIMQNWYKKKKNIY
jgi:beta-glucuronidase